MNNKDIPEEEKLRFTLSDSKNHYKFQIENQAGGERDKWKLHF